MLAVVRQKVRFMVLVKDVGKSYATGKFSQNSVAYDFPTQATTDKPVIPHQIVTIFADLVIITFLGGLHEFAPYWIIQKLSAIPHI